MRYSRIVVKVGTNVLTNSEGYLNKSRIKSLVEQVVYLRRQGIDVLFVSSGAVGAGRSVMQSKRPVQNTIVSQQILASVGQVRIINTYSSLFSKYDLNCSQILVTKEDFRDRQHYLNLRNCLFGLLQCKIIPIINENDAITISSLTFTDNDQLAGLLATMIDAEATIVITSVDGLYTGDPNDPESKLINLVEPGDLSWKNYLSKEKTSLGRGGMETKCKIASKNQKLGLTTHFINGKTLNSLIRLMQGENLGTIFQGDKSISSKKKWIANTLGFEKGVIYLDQGAELKLLSNSYVVSILPIGITRIEGNFQQGDVLKVCNQKGEIIGYGVAQYGAKQTTKAIGKKDQKPLIRYEYLYLEV